MIYRLTSWQSWTQPSTWLEWKKYCPFIPVRYLCSWKFCHFAPKRCCHHRGGMLLLEMSSKWGLLLEIWPTLCRSSEWALLLLDWQRFRVIAMADSVSPEWTLLMSFMYHRNAKTLLDFSAWWWWWWLSIIFKANNFWAYGVIFYDFMKKSHVQPSHDSSQNLLENY